MHEEREKDFPIMEDIIEIGKKKGYKFVTMEECLKDYEPGKMVATKKGSQGDKLNKDADSANSISVGAGMLMAWLLGALLF